VTTAIPPRHEIPLEKTWNLTDLFADSVAWKLGFDGLPSPTEVEEHLAVHFKGKLARSPDLVFEALNYRDKLSRRLINLYVYAHLRNAEDVGDSESSVNLGKVSNAYSALMSHFAFIDPELLTIDALAEWKEQAPLSAYRFELSELLRGKKHVLSANEERLVARLAPCLGRNTEIFSKWNDVDMRFDDVKDVTGTFHQLSHARYGNYMESQDRTLRENTFRTYYAAIKNWRNTLAANFYSRLLTGSTLAKIRGYDGFLQSQLFGDDIPVTLYDTLIDSVRAHLGSLDRSLKLRKQVLGLEALHHFDRSVSLASNKPRSISWDEARELVLASIEPLGAEYVAIARKGLYEERWIDYAENKGKRSGAFSSGTYDSRPYILMTWNGTLSDLYTLAHELGHSMHTYMANKAQPYHLAHYTIFVAEVASTLGEMLLTEHLLKSSKDQSLAEDVCSYWLKGFEGTVIRQVLFAAFEREASKAVDNDEPLTADRLDGIYRTLNVEWYGRSCTVDPEVDHEWMRVPHFYSTFYVYKYATSYCASLSLFERLKANPAAGREQVMAMLRTGGSKSPLDTMQAAGVDFLSGHVFTDAFAVYDQNIARAESLFLNKSPRGAGG
jgi:oligoendopeptidase F